MERVSQKPYSRLTTVLVLELDIFLKNFAKPSDPSDHMLAHTANFGKKSDLDELNKC